MPLAGLLALLGLCSAWYLPGIAPTDYAQNDKVPVLVNRLTSPGNNEGKSSVIGFDYYNPRFRFCQPEGGRKSKGGSLGSIIFGDRIYTSPIELEMLKDEDCRYICTATYHPQDAEFMTRRITQNYFHHWLVDGLPIAGLDAEGELISNNGFPLGEDEDALQEDFDEVRVFNHYEFIINYHHNQASQKYRVVGASIHPSSRNTPIVTADSSSEGFTCDAQDEQNRYALLKSDLADDMLISFSYSVRWEPSDTPWATRWDRYLQVMEPKVNWLALINTTILVFTLGAFCALTLMRMLRRDIASINSIDLTSDDIPDEIGWKLVAGDVFRAPRHPQGFALAVGSGAQILTTVLATLTLAVLGFLSPANRGSFVTALLLFNTVLGGVGGYVSAVVYKICGGVKWKVNLLLTPLVVPAIVFVMFFCVNLLLALSDASGAVPIGSLFALLLIWAGISVPLSLACGFFGFRRPLSHPPNMRVNQIPRQIPPQAWHHQLWAMMIIGGVIPFLAVSLQLRYIMSAIWFQHIYYMFGFLFASIWAMVMLSAASSLLALYFSLTAEEYRWQWRSFCVAGSPAIYVFLYSCYYMLVDMSLTYWTGQLLYLSYSLLISLLCFLALGSIGSTTAYFLVRRIYESIKME